VRQTTPFPPLADPAGYEPVGLDLRADVDVRAPWLDVFRTHFVSLLTEYRREAAERGADAAATEATACGVANEFRQWLAAADGDINLPGSGNVLDLCKVRERFLREAGIADPYPEGALRLLPARLAELDALAGDAQATEVIRGVFAGNVFDLGAAATVERFAGRAVDFAQVVADLKPRPWLVDELDGWLERLRGPVHRHAVLFVDNAGPDVLLGMLPLGRGQHHAEPERRDPRRAGRTAQGRGRLRRGGARRAGQRPAGGAAQRLRHAADRPVARVAPVGRGER